MTKNTRKGRDYSQYLLWAAFAVAVPRYMGAFIVSDVGAITGRASEILTVLMALTGIGMGVLDVLGPAYIFDGWRRNMPKAGQHWSNRFKILTGIVGIQVLASLGILIPFTVSRIIHQPIDVVFADIYPGYELLFEALWALAVNAAPLLIIGGVVTANTGVVSVAEVKETSQEKSDSGGKVSGNLPEVAEPGRKDWRNLPEADRKRVATMRTAEIVAEFKVSDRTARNWKVESAGMIGMNGNHNGNGGGHDE